MLNRLNISELEIIRAIRAKGEATRTDIVDRTGLSWASVSKITYKLVNTEGILLEGKSTRGKEPQVFSVKPDMGYFLGIAVGSTYTRMELVDFDFRPQKLSDEQKEETAFSFRTGSSYSEMIENIRHHMEKFLKKPEAEKLLGLGIAWPGACSENVARYSPTMPWLKNVSLDEILRPFLKTQSLISKREVSLLMDSSAKAAAVAEWLIGGDGLRMRKEQDIVCLVVGTGITAGLVLNNQPYGGFRNYAGQISHFSLDEKVTFKDEEEPVIIGEMINNVLKDKTAADLDKDEKLTKDLGRWVGKSISYIANLLNPELVIVTGRFGQPLFDRLYPTLRENVGKNTWRYGYEGLRIETSQLGRNSAAVGAAILAYKRRFESF